jgi:hypothetical protein
VCVRVCVCVCVTLVKLRHKTGNLHLVRCELCVCVHTR